MAILINDTTPRIQYTATSGQTVFTVPFEFFENADLKVYKNSTLLTITTNYTVTGAGVTGGGSVTLTSGATAGDVITIFRDIAVKRVTDFPTSGPFNISALNNDLDRIVAMVQEREDEVTRVIQLPDTDPAVNLQMPAAASRASRVLGFDATGNVISMQELGNYRGNWASGTAYVLRDLIKDTTNANIYICVAAHTSSGSLPITTNANAAAWALLVDAATATSSSSAAASSASAAASSASAAAGSASAASTSASNAATSASNAATSATNASNSASTASTQATNAANSASSASTSATNAANSATSASGSASTATTQASNASSSATSAASSASTATTQASNAASSASAASTSASNAATSASNAATSASNASSSATAAAAAQSAAETARDQTLTAFDNFDDRYLGTKTGDPTLDNDGNALVAGALYFNSTSGVMKVYTGSAWVAAYVSGSGFLATSGGTITGNLIVDANSAADGIRITQTGAGNALVVEDSANPDATPFVVNAAGTLLAGYTTPLALDGKIQVPVGGTTLSAITTNAGSVSARSHWRLGISDVEVGAIGTVGTSMTFLTNTITRMQITETGNTTITAVGTGGVNGTALTVTGTNLSGATTNVGISIAPTFGLGATVRGIGVQSTMNTEAGGAGLATAAQFRAIQGTLSTAVTSQYGFWADSTLIGATNNYGFYSNIASGTGRWNFYANGTADNYFAGQVQLGAGTVAAPALSTTGDTNTGIFFPTADTIAFSEGGAEVMRINSSGNVGIGTTSPDALLTVNTVASFGAGAVGAPSIAAKGDLNTGIYFSAADTLDFSTAGTQRGQFDSSGNFNFNSGYGSVATAYGCRAWVNFNGTGTVAIRGSGNVTSITDNGTGDYTVNFTNAMPDANYAMIGQGGTGNGRVVYEYNGTFNTANSTTVRTSSSCRILYADTTTGAASDNAGIYVSFFR